MLSSDLTNYNFFYIGALINFSLCFFNLIPLPPLDGFHILAQFIPRLKIYENSPLGLFALVIVFKLGIGSLLFGLSQAIIRGGCRCYLAIKDNNFTFDRIVCFCSGGEGNYGIISIVVPIWTILYISSTSLFFKDIHPNVQFFLLSIK